MIAPNPTGNEPMYLCNDEHLYRIYLHGYNHKAWETCKEVEEIHTFPAQQQNDTEYFIITKENLNKLIKNGVSKISEEIGYLVRQCPFPSPQHDTRIRKEGADAEREGVLDELLSTQSGAYFDKGIDEYNSWMEAVKSLRAQSPKKDDP
jgi:hypothetical protein